MSELLKYPNQNFVIETTYGSYPVGNWCFVTSRATLDEAKKFCDEWGEEYRVVNERGEMLYSVSVEGEE